MNEQAGEKTEKEEGRRKEGDEALARMTFGEHLEELRSRIWKCLWMVLLTFFACMFRYEELAWVITRPHFWAMEMIGRHAEHSKFLAGAYTDPFFAMIKLSFIVGFFLASPWVAYQLWAFVSAGLYKRERRYVYYFAFPSFALFVGGCVFGYFIMIPYGLYGLSAFQPKDLIEPIITFSPYLNLVLLLTIIMGCVFEVPLVMLFLAKTGLVDPATYSKWRKFAIVTMFVAAAMLTPPDPFTQLMMAGPLLVLYELGVILSKISVRRKPERT